jgi:hypothetical protein
MTENIYAELSEKYPFLSYLRVGEQEYMGIMLNKDAFIVSIYDYNLLPSVDIKKYFLNLGETWWWESNRLFPINIFLNKECTNLKPFIRNFIAKDVEIIHGPIISMNELAQKRTKRRNIQLVIDPGR